MDELLKLLDGAIFNDINTLYNTMKAMAGNFLVHARSLVALLMVMYFSVKGYGIMVGDTDVDILPLARPFALLLVILFWGPFVNLLEVPLKAIEKTGEDISTRTINQTNELFQQRELAYIRLINRINQDADVLETDMENSEDNDWWDMVIGGLEELEMRMASLRVMIQAKLKYLMFSVLEWIVLALFKACMYFIFYLKALIGGFLVALGPFAFAVSIVPGFKDAYLKWISRFVSVLLYGLLGHLAINTAMLFVNNALIREANIIETVINGPNAAFVSYVTMPNYSESSLIVAMIVGAFGMLSIPIVSNWIISMGSSAALGGKAMNSAKKAGTTAIKTVI
ncbi:hypothetical protein [Maribacter polysaccharolyticus]|uniref:hypothetical protein n=1 Tax=Maribacter polysaccharolyticus TaxID=3020831 RepID=UPI00237FA9CB|nr:hypothetical protein [Maribacter polysaccharolyticus]MDE3744039.1 hypothetical protein [Maribacter polysaccharolyticus]